MHVTQIGQYRRKWWYFREGNEFFVYISSLICDLDDLLNEEGSNKDFETDLLDDGTILSWWI